MAEKRKRPDRSEAMQPHLAEGDNSKFLLHSLRWWEMGRVDTSSKDDVESRSIEYLKSCQIDDVRPTVTGYANALGISRQHLHNLCNDKVKGGAGVDTIKKVKNIIEEQMENYMVNGKINPVAGIFLLKNNNVGYRDVQEIDINAKSSLDDGQDKEQLALQYKQAVPLIGKKDK